MTHKRPKPEEAKDAPPATMDLAWKLTCTKSIELGLVPAAESESTPAYDAALYSQFFGHLPQHRNARALDVDMFYANSGSAHDIQGGVSEIFATPGEVEQAIAAIEAVMDPDAAARAVETGINCDRPAVAVLSALRAYADHRTSRLQRTAGMPRRAAASGTLNRRRLRAVLAGATRSVA